MSKVHIISRIGAQEPIELYGSGSYKHRGHRGQLSYQLQAEGAELGEEKLELEWNQADEPVRIVRHSPELRMEFIPGQITKGYRRTVAGTCELQVDTQKLQGSYREGRLAICLTYQLWVAGQEQGVARLTIQMQ